ncbi:hypothetical protein [Paenalcaligenes hermetiae]|uniref:Uncharacterized protein n=1 Tax=Paenalcaligenes hermetiae TaxID=1157987 RepID=A0ABP9M5S0_9BURK
MTKVTLEQFRQQVKPAGRSKLDPFCDEIVALHRDGYSLDQILEFLVLNEVQVAKSTLHGFIKRRVGEQSLLSRKKVFSGSITKSQGGFVGFNPPVWADPKTNVDDLI